MLHLETKRRAPERRASAAPLPHIQSTCSEIVEFIKLASYLVSRLHQSSGSQVSLDKYEIEAAQCTLREVCFHLEKKAVRGSHRGVQKLFWGLRNSWTKCPLAVPPFKNKARLSFGRNLDLGLDLGEASSFVSSFFCIFQS